MKDWECHFCTALNDAASVSCWKCKKSQAESELEAARKSSATKQELEELERADALRQQAWRETQEQTELRRTAGTLDLAATLRPFVGATIGMNVRDPSKLVGATLRGVQADHIEVQHEDLIVRTPFSQILRITTPAQGDTLKVGLFGGKYILIIEVFHLVIYKGAVGIGFSVPI